MLLYTWKSVYQHRQNYFFFLSCCPLGILMFGGYGREEEEIERWAGGELVQSCISESENFEKT